MDLREFLTDLEPDPEAERRRLAREKSYAITDHLETFERRLERSRSGEGLVGSTAPSIFVGRSQYPEVPVGVLSPVGDEANAADYVTGGDWYRRSLGIEDVLQRRTGLLTSTQRSAVDAVAGTGVEDVWEGFVGVQREVAIADRPVDLEIGLADEPDLGLEAGVDVSTPRGPRAPSRSAELTENPHVPRAVERTLEDDDWRAEGAMTYLYRRGFDVYDIESILSAGALGRSRERRLVPTRWSITAVDDTIGRYLRGRVRSNPSVDEVRVWSTEYLGNRYWVIVGPGPWEFELVEMKAPGSIWNPDPAGEVWLAGASEGHRGRSNYVEETAGAYYAARLGVLEHLESIGRRGSCLVLREVSDDYWAPVGVWQVRESVRNAVEGEYGVAETVGGAVTAIAAHLPVSLERLRRKSTLATGVQSTLSGFGR